MYKDKYKELLDQLLKGNQTALLTYLKPNDKSINKKLVLPYLKDKAMDEGPLEEKMKEAFSKGTPSLYENGNESVLIEPYYPKPRLIIFGGGHIAKPLSELGHRVGFSVVVIDDRPTFANNVRFPDADEVLCEDFNEVFNHINIRESDFIVIVTRGHKHDGICLRKSLDFDPAYIGMIGSRRRVKAVKEELRNEGHSQEIIDSICSPIGLSIGAVTPDEIAISIIAEVISHRRSLGQKYSNDKNFNWPEFDSYVIKEMAKEFEAPRALVTIISNKGSVPRKAGAKMIVWLDGRLMGTIGGGCSEADIITLSRNVIRDTGYAIEHIDMTGEVAEENGMVCGGTMEVLIETF